LKGRVKRVAGAEKTYRHRTLGEKKKPCLRKEICNAESSGLVSVRGRGGDASEEGKRGDRGSVYLDEAEIGF